MAIFLNWLIALLVASLVAIVVLVLILNHRERKMWMKAFGAQYGISPLSMEAPTKKEPAIPMVDKRHKMSIPVPGSDWFRKTPAQK